MSLRHLIGRRPDQVVMVDMTDGRFEAGHLTDNGYRKVRLRLEHEGVTVEMDLSPHDAKAFRASVAEAVAWCLDDPGGSGHDE